jgi:hypothetical protein
MVSMTMAAPGWDELTRSEQRLLIKLVGGGTTRNEHPAVVEGLRIRGFINENDRLTMPGLLVFTLAMREQTVARMSIRDQ